MTPRFLPWGFCFVPIHPKLNLSGWYRIIHIVPKVALLHCQHFCRMTKTILAPLALLGQLLLTPCLQGFFGQQSALKTINKLQAEGFPLISNQKETDILVDSSDEKVVWLTAGALAKDLELVGGNKPELYFSQNGHYENLIIAGTIGQSKYIDHLVKTGRLDVSATAGKWESFTITTIDGPMEGVKEALVVAGSNPRGTAYGLFELSRAAGVSPWVWWADAVPEKLKALTILPGTYTSQEPSVKFRGIFLNDEDWGLQPWAAKTFEPETGDIGPKTYAHIFELLLRLRANLIWPAMHPCTKAFFTIPGNTRVAEDYAIIIGTSHAEPMLRNNVGEWNEKTMGHFNYITNKEVVLKYWEDRVIESNGINAMYSMGMRGVHDSKMEGIKDVKDAVPLLEGIIADQRSLLAKYINPTIHKVPQVFTAYKEVLDIYDNGLKLPDDITLVWPDDNYGYIQRLCNQEEKKRTGGSGVYYHASYWGRPHDYLWLSTTHPALMQEEMMKAFNNGSDRLWVLNVGDIKPLEYNTELFLDMAYNATPFKNNLYTREHLLNWAAALFGSKQATAIQSTLWEYYNLAFERRPEFMGWSQTEPTTRTNFTAFNHFYYGDEAQKRIDRYKEIENKARKIRAELNPKDDAAFYQMVYYQVVCASFINQKFLYRDKSHLYAGQNRLSAADYARLSKAAYDSIVSQTQYFNHQLSGGKWKYMMSMQPRGLPAFNEPELKPITITNGTGWNISPEGSVSGDSSLIGAKGQWQLPAFDNLNRQQYYIDVYLTSPKMVKWRAIAPPWLILSKNEGWLKADTEANQSRIWVSIDWNKAPKKANFSGVIRFEGLGKTEALTVTGKNKVLPSQFKGFIENNGYVSIKAAHFSNQKNQSIGHWVLLPNLNYSADAIQANIPTPGNADSLKNMDWIKANCSYLAYDFFTFEQANAAVTVFGLPTHPLHNQNSMRYAISIDDGPLELVDYKTVGRSEEWKQNVLRNRAGKTIKSALLKNGAHTLKIYCVDPVVAIQEILIDLGGLKKAYASITETTLNASGE